MRTVMELWLPVIGYESRYEVSNLGRVRSLGGFCPSKSGGSRKVPEHIMSCTPSVYMRVTLCGGSGVKKLVALVHRLVAQAFIPNPEGKPQINHKNGVKTDNRAENLEWVTASENTLHAHRVLKIKHAQLKGEKAPSAKLNDRKVAFIRKWGHIIKTRKLAELFSVHRSTILSIKSGTIWGHLPLAS